MAHPYRPSPRTPAAAPPGRDEPSRGMLGPFLFIWLPSVARLALALHDGERFTSEPVLALLLTLLAPLAFAYTTAIDRRRSRPPRAP